MRQDKSHPTRGTAVLAISGMSCGGRANTVARILSRVPAVEKAIVDLDAGLATITGAASVDGLIAAVEAAGYGAQAVDPGMGAGERHASR